MQLFPSFKVRILETEQMEKSSDEEKVINTVKQFKYTNFFFSRSRYLIKRFIVKDMLRRRKTGYTFLDVGAGGCDLAIWLARLCRRRRIRIHITCLDIDEKIVAYAKNTCRMYPEIEVIQGSVTALPQLGSFDYIFSNHFLHNFSAPELVFLLDEFYKYSGSLFLMNDLYRSRFSYWGFYLFARIFLRHSYATNDGLLSIRKGFLITEMQKIINATTHPEAVCVRKYLPGRLVVIGSKSLCREVLAL